MEKLEPRINFLFHRLIAILLIALLLPVPNYGQEASLFDHLKSFDHLDVFIVTDFRDLLRKRDKYQPAHIILQSGKETVLDTIGEIRSRGNMRKNICYMPPTKLRFKKSYLTSHHWYDYPTMKVVNCCAFNNLSETYVQLEYLLYDIYNLLTERSFNVCKVSLHYEDSEGKKNPVEFNGFLIEHEDQLADRIQGEIYEGTYFKVSQLDRHAYILFTMFQYMIGNTDWKVLNKHNIEIVKVDKDRTCYPIPYDFDYSGVVHATYAVPNESLPIKSVQERIYLGPCQTEDEVMDMRAFFLNKKDAIYAAIDNHLTDEREVRGCKNYLDDFFKILDNEKNAKAIFMNCRDY